MCGTAHNIIWSKYVDLDTLSLVQLCGFQKKKYCYWFMIMPSCAIIVTIRRSDDQKCRWGAKKARFVMLMKMETYNIDND